MFERRGDVGDVFRTLKDHRRHLLSVLLLTAAVKSSTTLSLSAFELSVFIIVLLCTIINHAVGQFYSLDPVYCSSEPADCQ